MSAEKEPVDVMKRLLSVLRETMQAQMVLVYALKNEASAEEELKGA